ncbi:hypothetical protein GUJ93_ZPchr0006g41243 [Zizania palustris]|uniref:Uncharacterized protein n=1 Tax=Zizania palustris TaxID=103762 RepID=A0A8J5TF59_ZIZPA|nr:hypothetical protein GUJ93_ZPchr0006g41243 [Zizania palustris]
MSWLRNAVHRAVEASGGHSSLLTRTVITSLDTVVHHAGQAVADGARLINDRIGSRSYKSMKVTAKRLEDAALSFRGEERVHLLRRWLLALKETKRAVAAAREPHYATDPDQALPVLDLYMDYDSGAKLMNFIHVFLYSQALEYVVLSMILEAPTEEEASLLSEIFGMCLSGGKDVHNAIISSIQELGKLFSSYHDEVLAKRDELLQFAQCDISGLKINADIARLDDEIVHLQQQINGMDALRATSTIRRSKASQTVSEGFKTAVNEARLCSRLEELVLMKKSIHHGDSFKTHFEKVDKLKVLSESLANSSAKAERRIMENRLQKEESLIFRVTKTNEVSGTEKELVAEISRIEEQKGQLEPELKKEEELSRSIASCKVESSTVSEKNRPMMYWIDVESTLHKYLEEEYLEAEKKIVATFSLIDNVRTIYFSNQEHQTRRDDPEVKNLFTIIDKLRIEFESVPRPVLQIEIEEKEEKTKRSRSLKLEVTDSPSHPGQESPITPQLRTRLPSESDSELAKFDPEYKEYSADDISGWEFDELEDEVSPGFL